MNNHAPARRFQWISRHAQHVGNKLVVRCKLPLRSRKGLVAARRVVTRNVSGRRPAIARRRTGHRSTTAGLGRDAAELTEVLRPSHPPLRVRARSKNGAAVCVAAGQARTRHLPPLRRHHRGTRHCAASERRKAQRGPHGERSGRGKAHHPFRPTDRAGHGTRSAAARLPGPIDDARCAGCPPRRGRRQEIGRGGMAVQTV